MPVLAVPAQRTAADPSLSSTPALTAPDPSSEPAAEGSAPASPRVHRRGRTPRPLHARAAARLAATGQPGDAGMTTAEYAVGTVAACGFGGVLFKLLTSPEVLGLLRDVITHAFHLGF